MAGDEPSKPTDQLSCADLFHAITGTGAYLTEVYQSQQQGRSISVPHTVAFVAAAVHFGTKLSKNPSALWRACASEPSPASSAQPK